MAYYNLNFKNQKYAYSPLILFFIAGAMVLMLWDKVEVFTYLNQKNTKFFDSVFPILTYLGEGWMCLIIFILMLFVKFGYAADLCVTFIIAGISVQSGKRLFFNDIMRPKGLLGDDLIHIIEGVDIHSAHSFPSGHSTTAMLLFLFLALIVKNPILKIPLIFLAFIGGYSRIYLSQHFFTDVYAGFLIGVFSVLAAMLIRNKIGFKPWFEKKIKLNF